MANDFLNFVTFFVSCSQTRMNVVYIREEPAVNPSLRKIKKFTQVKLNYISRNHNKPVRWMNFDEAFPRSPIYRNLWIAVPPKCSWFGWGGVRTFAPPRRTATRSSLLTQHVLQVFPSFVQIKEQRDPIHKNIILLSHKYKNRRVNDGRIWMKCHIYQNEAIVETKRLGLSDCTCTKFADVAKQMYVQIWGGTGPRGIQLFTNYFCSFIVYDGYMNEYILNIEFRNYYSQIPTRFILEGDIS